MLIERIKTQNNMYCVILFLRCSVTGINDCSVRNQENGYLHERGREKEWKGTHWNFQKFW